MPRLREPFVRKHIHRWEIRGDVADGVCIVTIRRCADCHHQQGVRTSELFAYSNAVHAVADVDWVDLSEALEREVRKHAKHGWLPK